MKQKLGVVIFICLLFGGLAGLNALSYVQKPKPTDSEFEPNRSTFNSGVSGTQAFYALLNESGRKVTRWRSSIAELAGSTDSPAVFVMVGSLRRDVTAAEATQILEWVSDGGRLVVIDREPPKELLVTTSNWQITMSTPTGGDDHTDISTAASAAMPVQPSFLTRGVNAVQPSRYSRSLFFERVQNPPDALEGRPGTVAEGEIPLAAAPVVHVAGGSGNLVVDAPFGDGNIIFVADPYIVSNAGIALADNVKLAVNLVEAGDGLIAFDEFHQGYAANNSFFRFFEGTPMIAIFVQLIALIMLVFLSRSARFARPLPAAEPDRLSKLEYVAAMAELQRRMGAIDLGLENIYTDFRRRAARLFGVDNLATRYDELARLISGRLNNDYREMFDLLFACEDIIRGAPVSRKETLRIVRRLRAVEHDLGLRRSVKAEA
ncbi:MAG: DUF4350 domain-containing protein [Acidobacteriota bacterium]